MDAAEPEIEYPVTITETLVPAVSCEKTATGVPPKITFEISPVTTPFNNGVPVKVAVKSPILWILLLAKTPDIVIDLAETVFPEAAVVILTVEAFVEVNVMVWAL